MGNRFQDSIATSNPDQEIIKKSKNRTSRHDFHFI